MDSKQHPCQLLAHKEPSNLMSHKPQMTEHGSVAFSYSDLQLLCPLSKWARATHASYNVLLPKSRDPLDVVLSGEAARGKNDFDFTFEGIYSNTSHC